MLALRKSGLSLDPEVAAKTSQTKDGYWVAWIERAGRPVVCESGKPKLFEAPSRFQAQCQALRWYAPEQPIFK